MRRSTSSSARSTGSSAHFTANANAIQGSGWSILAWDTLGQRLNVLQLFDQQGNIPVAQIPIVLLDMWEHAFYLQYQNVKADYVTAWWNVVNWADATERFDRARTGTGGPHRPRFVAPNAAGQPGRFPIPGAGRAVPVGR